MVLWYSINVMSTINKQVDFKDVKDALKDLVTSQKETDRQLKETDRQLKESKLDVDRQIKETDRQLKESKLDVDRQLKESKLDVDRQLKETDRQLKESKLDVDRQLKETDRRLKELDNLFNGQWGKLIEALVEGRLVKLLKQRQIDIKSCSSRAIKTSKEDKDYEFDIIAANGSEVVPVEVKTTMKVRDVDDFIKKLKIFKTFSPDYKNKKIYGAVAYLKAQQHSQVYAEKKGLFVIRAVGDSAFIINEKSFKPKAF